MKNTKIFKIVLSGLFAALTTAVTYFPVPVPIAHGYVNLGDCLVILSGVFLGPVYGFLASGIGSALADVFVGFISYAPATFIIKGLMAMTVSLIIGRNASKLSILKLILSVVVAEAIMVLGYLAFEIMLYGGGAIASVPGNCIQGVCCAIAGGVLSAVSIKSGITDKINNKSTL